jgi:tricorn protease
LQGKGETMQSGYYRFPTISGDSVVFVCEDDLWSVPADGGVARRLTSGQAESSRPALSLDGQFLAFTGREEGQPEIYLMAATGGPVTRLTYFGASVCMPVGWTATNEIILATNAWQPFRSLAWLYSVGVDGNELKRINVGPAQAISSSPDGGMVIGRNIGSPARWKRYRGGTKGQIWIDAAGNGDFQPLLDLRGNVESPIWLGSRIYFLSDHEGIGNLYSCTTDGSGLQRHTDHEAYYARGASSDGQRIVYHAGGDLHLFDPSVNVTQPIEIDFRSPQTQRNRKFVDAADYLDSWALHPQGYSLAITSRGKAFSLGNWEGAVLQHGQPGGARYRLLEWLGDGRSLVGVTDAAGEEAFVILPADGTGEPDLLSGLDIGRPVMIKVHPIKDRVIFSNHRCELCLLDLSTRSLSVIDRGKMERIAGFDWSPDGEWVAYSVSVSLQRTCLKLWKAATGEIFDLTDPVLHDVSPAFDPDGKYLYFLSYREFDPIYDNLHFDLGFPFGMRPYLITLQADLTSPFLPEPGKQDENKDAGDKGRTKKKGKKKQSKKKAGEVKESIRIDLDGISRRILPFPVTEGVYGSIVGLDEGRVLFSRFPVEGSLNQGWHDVVPPAKGKLVMYDLPAQEEKELVQGISDFALARDRKTLVYRAGKRLRVLKAGSKPDDSAGDRPGRASGWIDLARVSVSVVPGVEWQQMYREAWRLQRDHFWMPDMSGIDWLAVYDRYLPLVDRVASRSEFSDLIWEMQGELGTSHSYEIGGDYRPEPRYEQGGLGASFAFDTERHAWRVERVVHGDSWNDNARSPLESPGVQVKEGDLLLAVNGRRLSRSFSPGAALVNLAGQEVTLIVSTAESGKVRQVRVKTLRNEMPARYREWVESNRRRVRQATDGRVGYLHVPDMGPHGYAEFHRYFLAEVECDGLIVDLRFNNGGHVSQLLLEKLARPRLGYDITRWGQEMVPYPVESVSGPMVALTNEFAGSDGDIFCHGFKMMGLGPLIGKRTWGGVIGINPRHSLVDGTVTTQPEYSFWFKDVGWGVENYGTDPDIEIDNRPQDYADQVDAQLELAIQEVQLLLEKFVPQKPDLEQRPNLALPTLPLRSDGN